MKKLELPYRTLDEQIVKDGLTAVAHLEDASLSRGNYIVVGGVAVQSYLPTNCRRPTADLDLAVGMPLTYEGFKAFSAPVAEYMQDQGYKCSTRKGSRAFGVFVQEEGAGSSLLIEFGKHNKKSFRTFESIIDREIENSRRKRAEGGDVFYSVAAPEDIAVPKLVRVVNSFKRTPRFTSELDRFSQALSDDDVARLLEYLDEKRQNALYELGNPELAEELRVCSDLYDVRLLSELVGFNNPYLVESIHAWDTLGEQSRERDMVVDALLGVKL